MLRRLPDKHYLYFVYLLTFGRRLNWKQPTYWTEKTQWKKLYDRRSLLTQVADKIELRKYAVDKIGMDIMPKIFWEGPSPDVIPFAILPDQFVIKTNHGSGTNIIVTDKKLLDIEETIKMLREWLDIDFYYIEKEWAYKNIQRKVFVEELLLNQKNEIPGDIKLYMFRGKLGAVNIHMDRFGPNHVNIMTNARFEPINKEDDLSIGRVEINKPASFDRMVKCAEQLSAEFDFVRVDFYDLDDDFMLSELTNYPVGGFKRMPEDLDRYLGELWELPPLED